MNLQNTGAKHPKPSKSRPSCFDTVSLVLCVYSKLWFTIKIRRVQIKKQQNSISVHRNNLNFASLWIHLCHSPFCRAVRHRHRVQSIHLPNEPMAERQLGERRGPLSCPAQAGGQKTRHAWLIYWAIQPESTRPYLHSHLSVSAQRKVICLLNLNDLTWLFLWNPFSCTWRIHLEMKPTERKL